MEKENKKCCEHEDMVKFNVKYEAFRKKNDLPDFEFMNENFEIENLACEETELLAKKIRKQIMEKISSSFRTLEMFKNPQNAPLFIFTVIKFFNQSDKDNIELLYNRFADLEIEAFGLETEYNEKKEIDFIKKVCRDWVDICKDFSKIYDSMKLGHKQGLKKPTKSYFG